MNRFLLSCLVALLFGVGNMFALTCVTEDFTVPIPGVVVAPSKFHIAIESVEITLAFQ